MTAPPPTGRELLASLLDDPSLVEVAADEDLLAAGLNSGDIIRLALAIEKLTGEPLDDKTLARFDKMAKEAVAEAEDLEADLERAIKEAQQAVKAIDGLDE